MIAPFRAATEFHAFMTSQGIPYAIIGAIAVQFWGEPRTTQDVDLTIAVPVEDEERVAQLLLAHFPARIPDAATFLRRSRVLLLRASNGVPVDVSFGLPGYEIEVISRATSVGLPTGTSVRICSPEDLVIHKAVAGRPHDLRDLEGIVARRRADLDVAYIRRWLTSFSDTLAMPDPLDHFEAAWRKAHPPSPQNAR